MSKLIIQPFINSKGQPRFKVVGSQGKTFLDAFGHGYYTKNSAYNGIIQFSKRKNINVGNKSNIQVGKL